MKQNVQENNYMQKYDTASDYESVTLEHHV